MTVTARPEFSRVIAVDDVPPAGRHVRYAATEPERRALARRFKLVALEDLLVEGRLAAEAGRGRVRLSADVRAKVVQQCVVTLDPVRQDLAFRFERLYGVDVEDEWGEAASSHTEVILSLDTEVTEEPLIDGRIDVGEAAAEQLGLEIDPFPRSPGAVLHGDRCSGTGSDDEATPASASPFALLATLKARVPPPR